MKPHSHIQWRSLLLALLFILPLSALTSCGDDNDEPTTTIDYYIEVLGRQHGGVLVAQDNVDALVDAGVVGISGNRHDAEQ